MKRLNLIGFNALSKWMHRRYWKKQRADELKREPSMVEMSTPLVDWTDWLNSIDTLDKLTDALKTIKWKADPFWGAFHYWDTPVTVLHKGGDDCDGLALFNYDRLTAMGHEAHPYVCYKRPWYLLGFKFPWHFVCVWRAKGDYQLPWHVASNRNIGDQTHSSTCEAALRAYTKLNGYSKSRRMDDAEFMGYKG